MVWTCGNPTLAFESYKTPNEWTTSQRNNSKVSDRMTKSRSLSLEIVPLAADQPSTGVFVSVD